MRLLLPEGSTPTYSFRSVEMIGDQGYVMPYLHRDVFRYEVQIRRAGSLRAHFVEEALESCLNVLFAIGSTWVDVKWEKDRRIGRKALSEALPIEVIKRLDKFPYRFVHRQRIRLRHRVTFQEKDASSPVRPYIASGQEVPGGRPSALSSSA